MSPVYQPGDGSGLVTATEGKLVVGIDASKYVTITSTNPDPTVNAPWFYRKTLKIAGYYDGMILADPAGAAGSGAVWDGTFNHTGWVDDDHRLNWGNCSASDPFTAVWGQMNGKKLWTLTPPLNPGIQLVNVAGVFMYRMQIYDADNSFNSYLCWRGYRPICAAPGFEPVGTYTRTLGYDTTPTLTVDYV